MVLPVMVPDFFEVSFDNFSGSPTWSNMSKQDQKINRKHRKHNYIKLPINRFSGLLVIKIGFGMFRLGSVWACSQWIWPRSAGFRVAKTEGEGINYKMIFTEEDNSKYLKKHMQDAGHEVEQDEGGIQKVTWKR